MKGTKVIHTGRLLLRKYRMEDVQALYHYFGLDEEMHKYSGWNPFATPEMTAVAVRTFLNGYRKLDSYNWVIELDGELVGMIGAYDYNSIKGTIEVGFSIRHDQWGKGIATEALTAVLSFLIEEQIPCVTAWCAAQNEGSRRVLEKSGMKQERIEYDALKIGDKVYDKLVFVRQLPVDLTFHNRCGIFNYRVGAVIIHDKKLLLMKNKEEPYYYTVGGRVHFDETTEEAVKREVKEETGIDLEIDRFLYFQEQFFDGKITGTHIHELGVYYLMKDSPELDHIVCHSVTARGAAEEYEWIPVGECGQYYIVPESVAERLQNLPMHPEHIIEIDER
ncbi:MAG: GNAT family N-acetyltransferase [Eubacteriales bacterium]|nr:GNAT family N-acetyltransferase [Eubacteriales bacterium]